MESISFKRIDHVSLTVPSIDEAVDFYTRLFGAEVEYRMGPFDAAEIPPMEDGRDWTDAHIFVPGARLKIAMLKWPDGFGMELFEYEKPEDAATTPPRNCDAGSRHLCIEVKDIDGAIALLERNGCKAAAGSIDMEDGPCPASRSWYVLDPFGNQLELVQYL
ncbi:VOC family protein [Elongatibacter sediminis]|uniref:VOC family protein n=1 Tax=Elongatibacter sediminis TaxID=3119006 RepID=A0AAW9RBT5_9GAMM